MGANHYSIRDIRAAALARLEAEQPTEQHQARLLTKQEAELSDQALANILADDTTVTDILRESGLGTEVLPLIRLAIGLHLNRLSDGWIRERETER